MERTKLIEWAYASSTTATRAGHSKTGCWFVGLHIGMPSDIGREIADNKYFLTSEEAEKHADQRPEPYHKWHNYYLADKKNGALK
jgi:hypothetical protein